MKHSIPLLSIAAGLDQLGLLTAALITLKLYDQASVPWPNQNGPAVCVVFLFTTWFLGAYSYLRWPWVPHRQLRSRWLLVVATNFSIWAGIEAISGKITATALTLTIARPLTMGCALGLFGLLMRLWLHPLARNQATTRMKRSPLAIKALNLRHTPIKKETFSQQQLLLVVVAYHPSPLEVTHLKTCLSNLEPHVSYAVVVNDYEPGEAVEQLAPGAHLFLTNKDNPGYGRAANRLIANLKELPPYIGILNTDLSWELGTFEKLLSWLQHNPDVSMATPQILDEDGTVQKLCKQNPTALGLFSRRFVPDYLKPGWLKRYDSWYIMASMNYYEVLEAQYMSGCCMLISTDAFIKVGGFDERFFLYLEDADLTRRLSFEGKCVHVPLSSVIHGWGRGNYRNLGLMTVNLVSAWHYFRKWGWALW